jgi:Ca2+-binding EF-hand superfamily protein
MSLQLTRKQTPLPRKRRVCQSSSKKVGLNVADLMKTTEHRALGKLLDLLTQKLVSRILKHGGDAKETFKIFEEPGGGGMVLFQGFKRGCKMLNLDFSDQEMWLAFEKIDANHDGNLSLDELSNLILSHHTHILRSMDGLAKGQLRTSQLKVLHKLRQRGAGATIPTGGHVHGHRVNVLELQRQLKSTIWKKSKGDPGKLSQIFRLFQDTLSRNGMVTHNSFVHGLQNCGFKTISAEDSWALFSICDEKGVGIINFKQFKKVFTTKKGLRNWSRATNSMREELESYVESRRSETLLAQTRKEGTKINAVSRSSLRSSTELPACQEKKDRSKRLMKKKTVFSLPNLRKTWDIDKSGELYTTKMAPFGSRYS